MTHNWTLEDFYAGKVDASDDGTSLEDINRFLNWPRPLTSKYLYYGRNVASAATTLPSAPLSYFISLLDAKEAKQKESEYIYEPFSEEAAKGGAIVMYGNKEVEYMASRGDYVCVWYCDKMHVAISTTFTIRRTIETKEVECYVMPDGCIMSVKHFEELEETDKWKLIDAHGGKFETIIVTIKIPKK